MIHNICNSANVRLLGRRDPSAADFFAYWTGSGIEVNIKCRRLEIELDRPYESGTMWLLTTVDGAPVTRFPLENGRRWYTVLDGMDESVLHTVCIVRDTQPYGDEMKMPLKMLNIRTDGELLPLSARPLTIEFVGDSLTTGEGIVGPKSAMEWKSVWFSSYNYSQIVCDMLNANRRVVSQSGWGAYISWDGNKKCAIPRIYNKLCGFSDNSAEYDFRCQPADAVVINLGTNDASAINLCKTDNEVLARRRSVGRAAEKFIKQVRELNPDAYILWAYGMCSPAITQTFKSAVKRVNRQGDGRVGFVALPPCTDEDLGSRWHPGVNNHRKAAEAIAEHLKTALNL